MIGLHNGFGTFKYIIHLFLVYSTFRNSRSCRSLNYFVDTCDLSKRDKHRNIVSNKK